MIDWDDFGIYSENSLPKNWRHVLTMDDSGGYDWTTLHAFWSPTARRFFWHGGSGCSCNSWGDDLRSEADFQDGNRTALRKAIHDFTEEHPYSVKAFEAINAIYALAQFKGSK